MRTFLFFAVLFAMFIFTIVAAYKPAMIGKAYSEIKAPFASLLSERNNEVWRNEKDREWRAWEQGTHLAMYCTHPDTEIRKMECDNQRQLQVDTFERQWAQKVASGWKPEGVY